MPTYTLAADGDKIEQSGWSLFGKGKFPNYEIFWQRYIVPLTNRPTDIHLSPTATLEQSEIATIHYTIYYNFHRIYTWLSNAVGDEDFEQDKFEQAFVKLSNACDLTEELLFRVLANIGKFDQTHTSFQRVENRNFKRDKRAKLEQLFTKVTAFGTLSKRGSLSLTIINRVNVLKSFLNLETYLKISEPIRSYRNILVHSANSIQIDGAVPRIDHAKEYLDWTKVTNIVRSNDLTAKETLKKNFADRRDLALQETDKLIAELNLLWEHLIALLPLQEEAENKTKNLPQHKVRAMAETTLSGTVSLTSSPPVSRAVRTDDFRF